jgi:hypothetical protein
MSTQLAKDIFAKVEALQRNEERADEEEDDEEEDEEEEESGGKSQKGAKNVLGFEEQREVDMKEMRSLCTDASVEDVIWQHPRCVRCPCDTS